MKTIKSFWLIMMIHTLTYAGHKIDFAQAIEGCNNKIVSQCIQLAEYYKDRIQLDLAYKYYKKACMIDDTAKSNGVFVCNIAKNLENNFPDNFFR